MELSWCHLISLVFNASVPNYGYGESSQLLTGMTPQDTKTAQSSIGECILLPISHAQISAFPC